MMHVRPVLFHLFGLPIYAYGTALAVGFLVSIFFAARYAKKQGVSLETIIDIALALCIGGFIGGRLLYVLLEFGYYWRNPLEILNTRAGGMSFYGGAIMGVALAWWYGRRKKLDNWRIADMLAPYAALGYAITRVGCLFRGCCYGVPTGVPWGLACAAGDPTRRHPTQIYAILGSLLIFGILLWLRRQKHFPGFLLLMYGALYAAMRGLIETYRDDPSLISMLPMRTRLELLSHPAGFTHWLSQFLSGFRITQAACLLLFIYAVAEIIRRERRYRRQAAVMEVTSGEEMGRGAGTGPAAP